MATKSLAELYGFKKPSSAKKLNARGLRNLILREYRNLSEGEEGGGKVGDPPRGTAFDRKTSFVGVDAVEVVNQLLSGDDDAPILAAMKGKWFETTGDAAKAWAEKIGPDKLVARIQAVGPKIPATGLAKKDMPFLPGPPDATGDVADVKDALDPGGKYNVDFIETLTRGIDHLMTEKIEAPAPNEMTPGTPETEEFMTSGHEEKDGKAKDDVIGIELGGGFPAGDAKPTQTNILVYKGLGMAMNGIEGGDLDAYASLDNEILDGHHRWAATMLSNPDANIGTVARVDLKTLGTKETLKYLTAIGNALGNATKTESARRSGDDVIVERWQKLAGLLQG